MTTGRTPRDLTANWLLLADRLHGSLFVEMAPSSQLLTDDPTEATTTTICDSRRHTSRCWTPPRRPNRPPSTGWPDATDLQPEAVTRAAFDLRDDGLLTIEERTETTADLTDEAREYLDAGLPEIRLYRAAIDAGADDAAVELGQLIGAAGLEGPEVDIALANFARKGIRRDRFRQRHRRSRRRPRQRP